MNLIRNFLLLALLAPATSALACRTVPPTPQPTIAEIEAASDLIFVARLDRSLPFTVEEEARMKRFPHDLKDGEIFVFPSRRSQFTVIETLKGSVPTGALLSSATHSCGVMLSDGKEYMIFADMPESGGDIVAMKGSFNVTPASSSKLVEARKLASSIQSGTVKTP